MYLFVTGECAPTLAPWRPNEITTSEAIPHHHTNEVDSHALYDINDIVHFEDNDLVMRDSNKYPDQNKMENSVDHFKFFFDDMKKIRLNDDSHDGRLNNDVSNDLKSDDGKVMKADRDDVTCECQHGGGCVGKDCLCPLGYAGDKCEITLDLKVSR